MPVRHAGLSFRGRTGEPARWDSVALPLAGGRRKTAPVRHRRPVLSRADRGTGALGQRRPTFGGREAKAVPVRHAGLFFRGRTGEPARWDSVALVRLRVSMHRE